MPGIDQYTVFLQHNDTADLTIDSSPVPKTGGTTVGNVYRSATQSKFGGYSAFHNQNSSNVAYTRFPNHADYRFGTGDFTVDFWIYPIAHGAYGPYWGQDDYTLWRIKWSTDTGNGIGWQVKRNNVWTENWYTGYAPSLNTWHHIAAVRHNGTLRLYVDGIQRGSSGSSTNIDNSITSTAYLWTNGFPNGWGNQICYYDEIRISKGIARWTTNFTPPTEAYDYEYQIAGTLSHDAQIKVYRTSDDVQLADVHKTAGSYTVGNLYNTNVWIVAIPDDTTKRPLVYSDVDTIPIT